MDSSKQNIKKISTKDSPLRLEKCKWLDLNILKISRPKILLKPFSCETFFLVLSGKITFLIANKTFKTALRKSLFKDAPEGIFVPAGLPVSIQAESKSEIALCLSRIPPKSTSLKPFLITSNSAQTKSVGKGNYQRTVRTVLSETHPADFLLVGETLSKAGKWSSYPPHKHDFSGGDENRLEEIYYFRTEKENHFGFQSIYSRDLQFEKSFQVKNRKMVHIPFGYHPVCAPPDSMLYYLWVLGGPERKLRPSMDPLFH